MKAALYARVTSEEQIEGYSIDVQRRDLNPDLYCVKIYILGFKVYDFAYTRTVSL